MRGKRNASEWLLSAVLFMGVAPPAHAVELERVSFDEAVHRALLQNPTARIAQAELKRSWNLLEQARAGSLPTLSISGSYTRIDGDRVSGGTVLLNANETTGALTAQVPLLSPARWAQWSHARDGVDVAAMNSADVQRTLAVAVAHTYLTVVSQHRVIEVDERARDNARSHLEFTHARALGGVGSLVDEARAAQELAADISQLEDAYARLALLREALGVLLGVEHPVDSELTVALAAPPELEAALSDAHRLRTDLRLSELRLRAAEHVVRDEYTDYLPTLVGSFSPMFYTPSTPSIPTLSWQAQLALSFTLYDGGLREGVAHERIVLRDEARINREAVTRQLSADVRSATEELIHARRSVESARTSAKAAAQVLAMTDQAYRTGGTTNLEVIDAERRARDADNAAAVAEDTERQATIDLLAASGHFPR